jgi:hypothetical protein
MSCSTDLCSIKNFQTMHRKSSKGIQMNLKVPIGNRLSAVSIVLAMCMFSVAVHAADEPTGSAGTGTGNGHPVAEGKHAAKEIGHGVKKSTKIIGHGFRDGTRAVGHETKKATKEVGHGAKKSTKVVGHAFRDGTKEVGHETKKVTKEVGHTVRDGVHKVEGKAD